MHPNIRPFSNTSRGRVILAMLNDGQKKHYERKYDVSVAVGDVFQIKEGWPPSSPYMWVKLVKWETIDGQPVAYLRTYKF